MGEDSNFKIKFTHVWSKVSIFHIGAWNGRAGYQKPVEDRSGQERYTYLCGDVGIQNQIPNMEQFEVIKKRYRIV